MVVAFVDRWNTIHNAFSLTVNFISQRNEHTHTLKHFVSSWQGKKRIGVQSTKVHQFNFFETRDKILYICEMWKASRTTQNALYTYSYTYECMDGYIPMPNSEKKKCIIFFLQLIVAVKIS